MWHLTPTEVTVHHTAGVEEGQAFGDIQCCLQDKLHASWCVWAGSRSEHSSVNGHLHNHFGLLGWEAMALHAGRKL